MKHYAKHIPAALLGRHGYIQQLRAYSLVRKDDTLFPSLRETVETIDRAIDGVSPSEARAVLVNIYRNNRTLRETALDLGHSLHWVELYHAIGCNDFGLAMDYETGNYDLGQDDDGLLRRVIPSDHVPEPPDAATLAELARVACEVALYDD